IYIISSYAHYFRRIVMSESPIFSRIREELKNNDVVLYMKGTRKIPQCGFSAAVVQVLDRLGLKEYRDVNVLADPELRQAIKDFTDWPTIPQLYVKGEFIGGCDIVREMFLNGELEDYLRKKGVLHASHVA